MIDYFYWKLLYSYGINEDPVTGSAHCSLAPYWLDKLNAYGSKITGYQNSKRGGIVHVELSEDRTRVLLSGSCITIIKCKIVAADKSL